MNAGLSTGAHPYTSHDFQKLRLAAAQKNTHTHTCTEVLNPTFVKTLDPGVAGIDSTNRTATQHKGI